MTIELVVLGGLTIVVILHRNNKRRYKHARGPKGALEIVPLVIEAILFLVGFSIFLYGAISLALSQL